MTTEGNEPTEPADDSVHPKDPEPADETSPPGQNPLQSGGGPSSENVDGEAEGENAKETGGYGF
ncbi:hypothetical protein [Arthrobacter mobilis]|uniref:Uncharacterized protein n=1 Tax=Arthrobacter mobilis TaxID=2724944 RepID=A0A7X6HBW2_9MICC|nr:hypothetical protein [Arthrobacter mobilis]NKX53046.1 hypothetical protein [Arthrobacter mobilis]